MRFARIIILLVIVMIAMGIMCPEGVWAQYHCTTDLDSQFDRSLSSGKRCCGADHELSVSLQFPGDHV